MGVSQCKRFSHHQRWLTQVGEVPSDLNHAKGALGDDGLYIFTDENKRGKKVVFRYDFELNKFEKSLKIPGKTGCSIDDTDFEFIKHDFMHFSFVGMQVATLGKAMILLGDFGSLQDTNLVPYQKNILIFHTDKF